MGVLPLQFKDGQSHESLGLTGQENFDILGITDDLKPMQDLTLRATAEDGSVKDITVTCRIDTPRRGRLL